MGGEVRMGEAPPPRIWLIAGPTASGKSALALSLAKALGGEIVNGDSMQVYRDLRALTARPTPEDEAAAPHHLYVSPTPQRPGRRVAGSLRLAPRYKK